ncbi:hypothetical protein ACFPK5_00410 [Streptomyces beijiangensis]|uniref:hypothetical protein n=1 Tax=Streptomyces beijiangensis TaxID=163361 RepID=UPI003381355B
MRARQPHHPVTEEMADGAHQMRLFDDETGPATAGPAPAPSSAPSERCPDCTRLSTYCRCTPTSRTESQP